MTGTTEVADNVVTMKCMVTKKTFEVTNPEVIELKNGRHAYCVEAPWPRANGEPIKCYKFAPRPQTAPVAEIQEPEPEQKMPDLNAEPESDSSDSEDES